MLFYGTQLLQINSMLAKIEISPGVCITVNRPELEFIKYIKKVNSLSIDKLSSDGLYVIQRLLTKSILVKRKRGNNVYVQLHDGINIPEN